MADITRSWTTGYLIKYSNILIAWTSRLPSSIPESSVEAELRAVHDTLHDILFLKSLEEELFDTVKWPVKIYEDNRATYRKYVSHVSKLTYSSCIVIKKINYQAGTHP